jgi:predicted nucleic acid-binding protein
VRVVVADTGPLHYLVLIGEIDLLPRLFETVFVPEVVRDELRHVRTPSSVRDWLATIPAWLKPLPTEPVAALPRPRLGAGERAAIALAVSLGADLILMDDSAGVTAARGQAFIVTGTLGILDLAASHGMLDLADAFQRLKATNFRYQPALLNALLARHRKQD